MNQESSLEHDKNYLSMMNHPRIHELARIVDFPQTIEGPQHATQMSLKNIAPIKLAALA
ncbi:MULTISPECIES: hypothetical protein [unclassified Polynucleobacter]|jgi:hypothetical protein|uniref:hypothetical protein n=1 Tax=unclassified Polynucleobacter TaxID=2640945 RepID=UPI0013727EBB|nr:MULTISPECIES: hypothetical protein [unclassified Polynucleobacter]